MRKFLPLPLEVLRPLGAPTIGPPPRPISRSTAALFTDMEKFLCKHRRGRGARGTKHKRLALLFAPVLYFGTSVAKSTL